MSERGTSHESERIMHADRATGVEYTQITDAQVPSRVLYFEQSSFTADDARMLFLSARTAERGSPIDVFCVDDDGLNLVQLSDSEHPLALPVPSPVDAAVVFGVRGNALVSLNIDTFDETVVASCEEVASTKSGALTDDGRYYLAVCTLSDGETGAIARFRTDGTEAVTFCHGTPTAHMTASSSGANLMFRGWWEGESTIMVCDIDGDDVRPLPFQGFAHRAWFGDEERFQGTLLPPGRGIVTAGLDQPEPTPVCNGPYFWHSGSSSDKTWIAADTNWPDEGLLLVHVPTGRYTPLVKPASALGAGSTHPHPSFNRAGTKVIFTSNQRGLNNVHICTIPDHVKEELETGELNHRIQLAR